MGWGWGQISLCLCTMRTKVIRLLWYQFFPFLGDVLPVLIWWIAWISRFLRSLFAALLSVNDVLGCEINDVLYCQCSTAFWYTGVGSSVLCSSCNYGAISIENHIPRLYTYNSQKYFLISQCQGWLSLLYHNKLPFRIPSVGLRHLYPQCTWFYIPRSVFSWMTS